jgi:CRP-like cAMP-binding protein
MGSSFPPAYRSALEEIAEQYRLRLEEDPQDSQVLVDLANILNKLEQTDESLNCLRRAAWVYFNRGDYEVAVSTCGRVFRLRPVDEESTQLVEEVRRAKLLTEDVLQAALTRGRARRVTDSHPVVVLSSQVEVEASWDETAERPLPEENPDLLKQGKNEDPMSELETPDTTPIGDVPTMSDDLPDPHAQHHVDQEASARPTADERPTAPAGRPGGGDSAGLEALLTPELLARGTRRYFTAGATILSETSPSRELFVLEQGRVAVRKYDAELEVLTEGAFIGEIGLLGDGLAHLAYTAVDDCSVVVFSGDALEQALSTPGLKKTLRAGFRDRLQQMLLQVSPLFHLLPEADGRLLLHKCKPLRKSDGEVVVEQGDMPSGLYFVLLGRLLATEKLPEGGARVLDKLVDGAAFGELALVRDCPAPATITARGFCQLVGIAPAELFRFASTRPELMKTLEQAAEQRAAQYDEIRAGRARFEGGRLVRQTL